MPRTTPAIKPTVRRAYSIRPVFNALATPAVQPNPTKAVLRTNTTRESPPCATREKLLKTPKLSSASGTVSSKQHKTPNSPPSKATKAPPIPTDQSKSGCCLIPSSQSHTEDAHHGTMKVQSRKCCANRAIKTRSNGFSRREATPEATPAFPAASSCTLEKVRSSQNPKLQGARRQTGE